MNDAYWSCIVYLGTWNVDHGHLTCGWGTVDKHWKVNYCILAYGQRTVKINGEVTAESYRGQSHKSMNRINISIEPSVKAWREDLGVGRRF